MGGGGFVCGACGAAASGSSQVPKAATPSMEPVAAFAAKTKGPRQRPDTSKKRAGETIARRLRSLWCSVAKNKSSPCLIKVSLHPRRRQKPQTSKNPCRFQREVPEAENKRGRPSPPSVPNGMTRLFPGEARCVQAPSRERKGASHKRRAELAYFYVARPCCGTWVAPDREDWTGGLEQKEGADRGMFAA